MSGVGVFVEMLMNEILCKTAINGPAECLLHRSAYYDHHSRLLELYYAAVDNGLGQTCLKARAAQVLKVMGAGRRGLSYLKTHTAQML